MDYGLGKLPARPGAIKFAISNYVNLELPIPPSNFRHAHAPKWHDYLNKKYGTCLFGGAANETRLWEHEGGLPIPEFSDENILAMYSKVGGFDIKRTDATDNGADVGRMAAYRRKVGIIDATGKRHKVDAYGWLKLKSITLLRAAVWVFGAVGVGFQFPKYAMTQFKAGKVWDIEPGMSVSGHYVPCVGFAPNGNLICVSWGKEQEMTQRFYIEFADEVVCYLDLDRMSATTKMSPEGFNEQRLRNDLRLVTTGRLYAVNEEETQW